MKKHIAIDGPAGSGKSTVARIVAKRLSYLYLDTGSLYRAVTLYFIELGIAKEDIEKRILEFLKGVRIAVRGGERMHVFVNGRDVTEDIRKPQVDALVSYVARIPEVRAFLRDLQRRIALSHPSVVEGRDIGTVILPEADLKIFLTASPEIRAQRRWKEMKLKGNNVDYKVVLKNVLERDTIDSQREHAPLRKAEDAVLIDSSFLTIEEVVRKIHALAVEGDCAGEYRPLGGLL